MNACADWVLALPLSTSNNTADNGLLCIHATIFHSPLCKHHPGDHTEHSSEEKIHESHNTENQASVKQHFCWQKIDQQCNSVIAR